MVKFQYVRPGVDTFQAVSCDGFGLLFLSDIMIELTVNDSEFIEEFEKDFYSLQKSERSRRIDTRIKCLINYRNNSVDTLCMGEYFAISLNGEWMEDNEKLLRLIKQRIYDPAVLPKDTLREMIENYHEHRN